MSALHRFANAFSDAGKLVNGNSRDQSATIGTSATHQFAAAIFGLIEDAPEHWIQRVGPPQDRPKSHTSEDYIIVSPYVKDRSSTESLRNPGSAHDSGYGAPPDFLPELDLGNTTKSLFDHDRPEIDFIDPPTSEHGSTSSLLSLSINERGFSGVGTRPTTAPERNYKTTTWPVQESKKAALHSRIKHGSERISACISDFCRPSTAYAEVSSSIDSSPISGMISEFPLPPMARHRPPPLVLAQTQAAPLETPRAPLSSSIKGVFKSIKQKLLARQQDPLRQQDTARQTAHRGSVMEQGANIVVTPYDVVEWRQNGRSVKYLVSPRLMRMREGMLLASSMETLA